jgi:hypothetical protein
MFTVLNSPTEAKELRNGWNGDASASLERSAACGTSGDTAHGGVELNSSPLCGAVPLFSHTSLRHGALLITRTNLSSYDVNIRTSGI